MSEFISINLRDYYSLLAVWEFQPQGWELVTLTRLKQAILLCTNHPDRLAFPPKDNPNHIWQKRQVSCLVCEASKPVKNWERILDLIETSLGQSIQALAEQLKLSGTTIRRNLKQLETKEKVYSRICLINGKTRLYYRVPATRRSDKPSSEEERKHQRPGSAQSPNMAFPPRKTGSATFSAMMQQSRK